MRELKAVKFNCTVTVMRNACKTADQRELDG